MVFLSSAQQGSRDTIRALGGASKGRRAIKGTLRGAASRGALGYLLISLPDLVA